MDFISRRSLPEFLIKELADISVPVESRLITGSLILNLFSTKPLSVLEELRMQVHVLSMVLSLTGVEQQGQFSPELSILQQQWHFTLGSGFSAEQGGTKEKEFNINKRITNGAIMHFLMKALCKIFFFKMTAIFLYILWLILNKNIY